jgi:ArsR family transcriptional regulator
MATIKELAPIFKLLGEPNRLEILCSLQLECRPVSEVVAATGLSQTNVSFHLRALREAGLVSVKSQGQFKYYCVVDDELFEILNGIKSWAHKNGNCHIKQE